MTLRPEEALLLRCAAPGEAGALDADGIDWDRLWDLAESHKLLPLVYWRLKPASMEESFRANLKNSLLLTRELVQVMDLLAANRIPIIPFKGPTLALRAYRNLALRSFCDLDILVGREDVWRARDVLERAGYRSKLQLDAGREAAYLDSYDEVVMYGPDGTTLLEVHWFFVPPHFCLSLDFADCAGRLEQLPLGNRMLPSLHREDLLLVLCAHGSKHCWSHLGLICDVAWLLTSCSFDWDAVLGRARRMGILRMVLVALALAEKTLGVKVAAERDVVADRLADEIIGTLFGDRHDEGSIMDNGSLHLRMRERWRDKARYFLKLATRPGVEDWEVVNLPASLNFLYRVLRFPRLAVKYLVK